MYGVRFMVVGCLALALVACGGGGSSAVSADPATQAALTAIAQKAASETLQANSADPEAVKGVQRNAEILKSSVLSRP